MAPADIEQHAYHFDGFVLDIDRGTLLRDHSEIRLRPKSFDVLRYLVEHRGHLVSRTELLEAIWGHTAVTDDSVTQCLIEIRKAIGDTRQTKIRTVPKRGYLFDLPVILNDDARSNRNRRLGVWPAIVHKHRVRYVIPILAVAMLSVWWLYDLGQEPGSNTPSIAVLAFKDMSEQQNRAFLSESIPEQVLHLLTRVPELGVIARTSSFSFKDSDADIATIAERLGATHILEGSVQSSGRQVRVTVQLIDAGTSEHVWSEIYDVQFEDVFQVQDEIASAVARRFGISPDQLSAVSTRVDANAYAFAQQAYYFLNRYDAELLPRIAELLNRALQIEPDYVFALIQQARLVQHKRSIGLLTNEETERQYRQLIDRALSIDPQNASAHMMRGAEQIRLSGDVAAGIPDLVRAMELDPTDTFACRFVMRFASEIRRYDIVMALGEYLLQKDPLCSDCQFILANAYLVKGRFEDSYERLRSARLIDGASLSDYSFYMFFAKLLQGDPVAALSELEAEKEEVLRIFGAALAYFELDMREEFDSSFARLRAGDVAVGRPESLLYMIAAVYAWTGDADDAFEYLYRVVEATDERRIFSDDPQRDYLFANLQGDPRWARLLQEDGSAPDQLAAIEFDIPVP